MAPSKHPLQEGTFDPLAMLRQVRDDGSDTRAIRLRMLWLRQREPTARVSTELVRLDERVVVMAASVALSDGAEGTGHAASSVDAEAGLAATIEATELRAIGRALDALGYVVIEPHGMEQPPNQERPQQKEESSAEAPAQPEGTRSEPPDHVRAIRSIRDREQRQQPAPQHAPESAETEPRALRREPPAPAQRPTQAPAAPERSGPRRMGAPAQQAPSDETGEPALEDVSWTAFWNWARETYQLRSRVQLEELLGQPVGNKSPGELRQLLIAHFDGENGG